jgi:polysaccharide biosynthesis transport protein
VLSERGVLSPTLALKSLDDPQALLAALRSEEAALAAATDQLTKESEDLKRQVADDWRVYSTAFRANNQAREVYSVLSRKVSEAQIQERIDPAQLTLVSAAVEPRKPTQTRQVAQYAVAGMIGLILGVIVALWSGLRDIKLHQPPPAQVVQ